MKHTMTPAQELSYIAAFVDGEGYITCRRQSGDRKIMRRIGFVNTDESLARAVIGGLAVSAVQTIFLVPAAYLLIHGKQNAARSAGPKEKPAS